MQRTLQAADIAGIRAFAVHAKDEEARNFYQRFDFIPSPTDPLHLFVLLKDVRRGNRSAMKAQSFRTPGAIRSEAVVHRLLPWLRLRS
jgi:hypothetical protein